MKNTEINEASVVDTHLTITNERGFYQFSKGAVLNLKKKFEKGNFDEEKAAYYFQEIIRKYLKLADDSRKFYAVYGVRSALEQYNANINKAERLEIAKRIISELKDEEFNIY